MTEITIGVDISKDALDAHRLPEGVDRQFPNMGTGHKALVAWIGHDVERVVFEPTGPYHGAFERALADNGLPAVKVNPRHAHRFAEATGKLAKTDCLDAALLAKMGALLQIAPRPPRNETLTELRQLHLAHAALLKDRTAAKNRAKIIGLALLKRQNTERMRQIERQLAAIDAEIERRIRADAELSQRFDILMSIPGVAQRTASTLLIEMPELGCLEAKQAASLSGLAPVTRQSGRWAGRASIRGGRADVRQALYMPALAAMRFNPQLKTKYQDLIARGKPQKVTITAVMRKLIVLANALLKARRHWMTKYA
ncbi:MAG: IS110 family transposase [Rhodospirillales bacterium]|nr:IS110 family transposase [Rhodospirillales bacterium]